MKLEFKMSNIEEQQYSLGDKVEFEVSYTNVTSYTSGVKSYDVTQKVSGTVCAVVIKLDKPIYVELGCNGEAVYEHAAININNKNCSDKSIMNIGNPKTVIKIKKD
jgi:hypothetical protein